MKIDRVGIKKIDTNNSKNTLKAKNELTFDDIVDKKSNDFSIKNIHVQLSDINDSGKKLANRRTIENLFDYKGKIKRFLDESLEAAIDLDKRNSFRRGGSSRTLKKVRKIDEKLLELTDELINRENNRLNLLRLVGEIQGMLINIYI